MKQFSDNRKLPPITTIDGTRYRKAELLDHFRKRYHVECKKAKLLQSTQNKEGAMDVQIRKANKTMANHIGKLMLQIYNDGKKLTLSGYSWPSRFVSSESSNSFKYDENAPTIPSDINLQYVNRPYYLEFLKSIVKADRNNIKTKIQTAIAFSIRADGSVDRTQIDNIYVMLKLITEDGKMELILLGVAEQTERGAAGLKNAVREAILKNLDRDVYTELMTKISSICTDGTNVNSGDKGGLWKLFDDEVRADGSEISLVKIWCSAHRLDLAWDNVCSSHKKIRLSLEMVSSIGSYFRQSAVRTRELRQIAAENGYALFVLPKLFSIRWTQFTFTAVNNVLCSWRALIAYFTANKQKCAQASGFLAFISNEQNLRTLAFLADVLEIFHRYHMKNQSNDLTIVSLVSHLEMLKKMLSDLTQQELLGGWENLLKSEIRRKTFA